MTQTTVGIRELKAQLSAYVQRVKAGDTVVITERGKAVGRIVPIERSVEERLQDLIASRRGGMERAETRANGASSQDARANNGR